MNVVTKIRLLNELNAKELRMGVTGTKSSWHHQYKDSAWVYVGSLSYELSEGDVICVLSQYGEVMNINMIRDKKTGKSKGFAFVCYEDQRSTILAVDNLNGTKIKGRQIRVDHIMDYKVPKEDEEIDELTMKIREKGVAPQVMNEYEEDKVEVVNVEEEVDEIIISDSDDHAKVKKKKQKKEKKKKGLSFLKDTPSDKAKKTEKSYSLQKSTDTQDKDLERKSKKHKQKRSHVQSDDEVPEKRSKKDLKLRSSRERDERKSHKHQSSRSYKEDHSGKHDRHQDDRRERQRERSPDRGRKHRRHRSRSR